MLILFLSSDFNTGCNSSSVTAKSPSTTALSSLPAKAAQVFTPMSVSILTPCIVAGRPMVNFTIPSFDSPWVPKISLRGAAVIEFFSGSDAWPTVGNDSAGFAFGPRIGLIVSYIFFTAVANLSTVPSPSICIKNTFGRSKKK